MADLHPIDIGSRLELMVDEHLIAQLSGGAELAAATGRPSDI